MNMELYERIEYSNIQGNVIALVRDEYDYEVSLNGLQIMSTGDEAEAEIVAESLEIALTILQSQKLLLVNK